MMSTGLGRGMPGVAILVTLLLSSALGTTWVDVEGGVTPDQAAGMTMSVPDLPAGVVGTGQGGIRQTPSPELLPLPLDYVYLDPPLLGVNMYPWFARGFGFREQHLYLASEIGRGGTIDQIALFKTHADTYAATFPNVTVKMCHTNVTSLSRTFIDNYGGQTPVWVFHQTSGFVRGGNPYSWEDVNLQTSFDYNGTDNLLVEITWIGDPSGLLSYSRYKTVSGYRRAGADDITDTLVADASYTDNCFYNTRIGFRSEPNDVGVLSIISPIEFVGFGDSVVTRGRVANCGSQPQMDVPVACVIYDSATGARVYAETVYLASLDTGEVCTVTFPSWSPPVEDKVYFDTMMTVLQGDQDTTNDRKARRFTVAAWGEGHLTYNDGTSDGNCYSWTTPNYTVGVRFPGPCPVGRIAVGLWAGPGGGGPYPCTCKVRLNDGANGMPGTEVWVQPLMLYGGDSSDYINYVVLDPPAVVTSDSFYVTWKPQQVAYPFMGADSDEPIQVGNDFSTEPNCEVFHALSIGPERDENADLIIDVYYAAPLLDGAPKRIAAPQEQLDSGATFIPQVIVRDAGLLDRDNIVTRFIVTSASDGGDTVYSGIANTGPIQARETRTVSFADSVALATGNYFMTSITLLPYDGRTGNDTLVRPLAVGLGIADVSIDPGRPWVSIAPNPLGKHATVRYSLPKAGLATFELFDVTGRMVLEQTLAARRTGTAGLDLRKLEAGVYLVKISTEGFSTTQKLVVEH